MYTDMKFGALSKLFLILFVITAQYTAQSLYAAEYLYSKLQMKSYDEMVTEVKARVQKAERVGQDDTDEAKKILRDSLVLIFSRPNRDNMVSQLTPIVRTPLKNLDSYEDTISDIASDAVTQLKGKKSSAVSRATQMIVLENIMSEMKPDVQSNATVKAIFTTIRDAKISVPDDVKNELRMRSALKPMASPSDVAAKVLAGAK
jgi:hypothetical protein